MARKGMGFKAAAQEVAAKQHIPLKNAKAIIAEAGRNASPKAKKANPNLRKIKGK